MRNLLSLACIFLRHSPTRYTFEEIRAIKERSDQNYAAKHPIVIPAHTQWKCERCGAKMDCEARKHTITLD